jgi:hypoxanthine-guanine phosphoribosyltransferase
MNQGSLSSLYRPEHVRLWLTTPTASLKSVVSAEIQFDRFQVVKRVREIQKAKSRRTHMDVDNGQVECMEDVNDEGRLLDFLSQYLSPSNRTASLSAALLLIMPTLMLNVSVNGLLVALGLYSAFMWTRGLDDGETDWRNIFIFYTVGSGFMLFLYFIPNAMKDLDSAQYTKFKRMKATIEAGRRTTEMQQPVDLEQQLEGDAERATIGLAQSLKMSLEAQERLLDANKDLLRQLQRVNLGLSP